MNRLQNIFASRRPALVIFDSCGAPTLAESEQRLETIVASGADIVELGVPFSDPMADGPAIQRASLQALKQGTTLKHVIGMAERLRKKHPDTGPMTRVRVGVGGIAQIVDQMEDYVA